MGQAKMEIAYVIQKVSIFRVKLCGIIPKEYSFIEPFADPHV
jgi:hypothetical protein